MRRQASEKPANVVGPTVRGPDFWGREEEIGALWRQLGRANVLLTAPRRYGKSSVMNALADDPLKDWTVLYLDVEYVETPSMFLTELTAALLQLDAFRSLLKKAMAGTSALLKWVREFVGTVHIGIGELKIALRDSLDKKAGWAELAEQLLFHLERLDNRLLLIVDEFPMMIANFLDADKTTAVDFLKWFRAQRQRDRKGKVRFLLGGSVNIEPRLEQLGRETLINDLDRFRLQPLSPDRAVQFVTEVMEAEGAQFVPGLPAEIVRIADCGIHFLLQVLISECLAEQRHQRRQLTIADVDAVYQSRVLGPSNRARFSHYRSRLREYYGSLERAAHIVLDDLAAKRELSVEKASSLLRRMEEDAADVERLLALLESDYYIERDGEQLRFSSGFLRQWWLRNAVGSRNRQ